MQRREEILKSAEAVFFNKGFEKTTMDDIARYAQLSRALLYVYFKDKSAIMREVMLRAASALRHEFAQALASGARGVNQIEGIGHAYYRFSREQPDYFDVLTHVSTFPGLNDDDDQNRAMSDCRHEINQLMVQALCNGIADGSLRAANIPDPLQTAFYLQGALHGVIMQTRSPKSPLHTYPDTAGLINYTIAMLTLSMQA